MRPLHAGLVSIALAISAQPGAAWATAERLATPAAVELLSPDPATPLAAGSTAVLEWKPVSERALPAGDEWEAFVSLNGGRSYTLRITPHLDRRLRRVQWTVPEVPAGDVRILLRFGDERHEVAIELPRSYAIQSSPAGAAPLLVLAAGRGESARPGEAGVAMWVEGPRNGGEQRRVVALEVTLRTGLQAGPHAPSPAALRGATAPPAASRRGAPAVVPRPPPEAEPATSPSHALPPVDRLLQTARRNE
jgi:hypothetical protein